MEAVSKRACSFIPHDSNEPDFRFELLHPRDLHDLDVTQAAYNRLGELGPQAATLRLILSSDIHPLEGGRLKVTMNRADLLVGPAAPL